MEPSTVIRKVALYARVSTHEQNVDMQISELRSYAALRGWEIVAEYVDIGISGSKDSRPELDRLLKDAKARRFDGIAVFKLDRFGRSLRNLVVTLADLSHYGVSFVALRDNLDLSSPAGRLQFHIIAAMAEFERELIKERVVAGIQAAKNRGVRFGRPKRWVSADKITALREQGIPWVQVAKKLGAGKGTCQRAYALAQKEDAA